MHDVLAMSSVEQPAVSTHGVRVVMSLSELSHRQVKSVTEQPMFWAAVLRQVTAQVGSWLMRPGRPVDPEEAAVVVADWAAARPKRKPRAVIYFILIVVCGGFSQILLRVWIKRSLESLMANQRFYLDDLEYLCISG